MAAITFDRFDAGLDLRKGAAVSDANRLRVLDNCYVTTGRTIRKRPGLRKVATIETGTKGLRASGGALNTFYATGTISHASPTFKANKIAHPSLPAMDVAKIHYADVFNGYLYVSAQYNNGDIRHHYIDGNSSAAAWSVNSDVAVGDARIPTTANGFRYEVVIGGVTAGTEPAWGSVIGDTQTEPRANYTQLPLKAKLDKGAAYKISSDQMLVQCTNDGISGPVSMKITGEVGDVVTDNGTFHAAWENNTAYTVGNIVRPIAANGFAYEVTTAGISAAAQPTWPVIPGTAVINGTVTFTCRGQKVWVASAPYMVGAVVKPTAANSFWYEATATSGSFCASAVTEPTWPSTPGSTVTEKDSTATAWVAATALAIDAVRRPIAPNGFLYLVTQNGTTGATQPAWPTTPGNTVTSGTVTFMCVFPVAWVCRDKASFKLVTEPTYKCHGTEIYDTNCPHTASVSKKASKVFATKNDVVRFSKTNDPRDWSASNDAGFLGVGVQQSGAANPTALGEYSGNMVVFFRDSSQVWAVDPDPANMKFLKGIDVGCPYPYGAANMAGDVFFASFDGVRSITTQSTTGNLIDVDVGSPIDPLVKSVFTPDAQVRAFYFRGGGQYWATVGPVAYVYSFSRTSKISAWSRYIFPFDIFDVTELDGDLYFRSGDDIFVLDEATKTDDGAPIRVVIEFPYLDFQSPGVLKMIHGMDSVMIGSATVSHRYDSRDPSLITVGATMSGDTRPGDMTPVEICTVGIAPVIVSETAEDFELHALTYRFETLGAM